MNKQKRTKRIRLSNPGQRLRILLVALFMVAGTYLVAQSQAAAGYIYVSPASASKYVGDTFTVQVRIKTTSPMNAAFVNINYNGVGLQVLTIARGSSFPNQNSPTYHAPSTTGTGRIKMESTRNSSIAGDLHFATITFKARAVGKYGVAPISSSRLINYPHNDVSYTLGRADYSFSNRPAPAPKPSTPTPTSPLPAMPKPSHPTPSTAPSASVPETESAPSASNLKISKFRISEIGYRSAKLTWTTNQPATSKANYGFSADSMPNEVSSPTKTTSHTLIVRGDNVRAGEDYAVRITSDDGAGPVTIDAEFSTKSVVVSVVVKDADGQPVAGATVRTEKVQTTTEDDGMVIMAVPEGSVPISADKDGLSGDIIAEVNIPESEPASDQQFDITLGASTDAPSETAAKDKSQRSLIVAIAVMGLGLVAIVFGLRWRRQRAELRHHFPSRDGDLGSKPLGRSDPAPPVAPPMMPMTPGEVPHYTSLSELVKQDLGTKRKEAGQLPEDEPKDMFEALDHPQAKPKASHPGDHHKEPK